MACGHGGGGGGGRQMPETVVRTVCGHCGVSKGIPIRADEKLSGDER